MARLPQRDELSMIAIEAAHDLILRVQSDEFAGVIWTVLVDTVRQLNWHDNGCVWPTDDCPWVRSDVEDASGDRFHFRYQTFDPD